MNKKVSDDEPKKIVKRDPVKGFTPKKSGTVKIMPLKDHKLVHNKFSYDIKEGKEIEIDRQFIETLKNEKVINS